MTYSSESGVVNSSPARRPALQPWETPCKGKAKTREQMALAPPAHSRISSKGQGLHTYPPDLQRGLLHETGLPILLMLASPEKIR